MERDFTITLKLDRSEAEAAAQKFHAAEKARLAETAEAGKRATRDQAQDHAAAHEKMARGSERFRGASVTAYGAAALALRELIGLAGDYGTAVEKALNRQMELTRGFSAQREQLAELASLMGRQPDTRFVLEQQRFAARTGMSLPETIALRTEFMNSGAQFVGAGPGKIPQGQADVLQEGLAQLALARQIDPRTIADFAGRQLGFRDYSRFGGRAAETALADINQAVAVGASGTGSNAQLAREAAKLSAASVNENATRGTLRNTTQAMTLISAMTEGFPEGQAEAAQSYLRFIRGFKGKQAQLLKEAGVTPETDPFEAGRRLAPVLERRAARGAPGTTVQDVLGGLGVDMLEARAAAVVVNRGVTGGIFAAREATAAENAGPEALRQQLAQFRGGDRGLQRLAEAGRGEEEARRGAAESDLLLLRTEAERRLIAGRRIDTPATNFMDAFNRRISLGTAGDMRQNRIDVEAQRLLDEQSPESVFVRRRQGEFAGAGGSNADVLGRQLAAIREAGGNPFAGLGLGAGAGGGGRPEVVDEKNAGLMTDQNRILAEMRDMMKGVPPAGSGSDAGAATPAPAGAEARPVKDWR